MFKTAKESGIYSPKRNQPVGSWKGQNCPSGRSPGRPELDTESRLSVRLTDPVDRGHFQRAELSGRSTDPVDRPTSSSWRACLCTSIDRTGRPTSATVDRSGRPTCTRMCTLTCHLGRSTERSTNYKYPTLGWGRSTGRSTVRLGTVDRAVAGQRAIALWIGTVDRAVDGHFFDRWPVDRPVDRKANLGLVSCQRLVFQRAYL